MELSEHIKAIRESKRIKLNEIATTLGVDVSNYAKMEKKGKKLTLERLEEIAAALDISLLELLDSNGTVERLEKEKAELQRQLTAYGPLIQLVNLLSADPERLNNFADKMSQGGVKKEDIEEQFPDVKEQFEKPKKGTK